MARNNAFTLIELLIVITIIAVMSGLSMAFINSYTPKKNLEKEQDKLADTLAQAQKNSQAGGTCVSGPFDGYQVTTTTGGYTMYKCCGVCATVANRVYTYSFPSGSGITLSSVTPNSAGTIHFKKLSSGALLDGSNANQLKQLYLESSYVPEPNNCIQMSVNSAGLISSSKTYTSCD